MECKHGLPPWFCSTCAGDASPWVFHTVGGSSYHTRPDCEWLEVGTPSAHRRGLTDHPVERTTRAEAVAYLYQPCDACMTPEKRVVPTDDPSRGRRLTPLAKGP
jgi:hypothetical protein